MASDKQVQKAGDNSTQIQANAVYVVGIDEKRAREVYTEMSEQMIAQCTSEAAATANARIGKFKEELIPRVERIEKDFRSFSDPSFQVLLKKAQLTAACTGRDSDYAILAELLTHRIKNKDNVKKKASIQRAIEVIDQIDDDSLVALAILHAVNMFWPNSGLITIGLQSLSQLYESIGCSRLPSDGQWIDNLLVVGAITTIPFSVLPKYEERFRKLLDGYVTTGIKKGSENYKKAVDILINNAGTGAVGPAEDMTDKQFENELNIDLFGSFRMARAVAKHAMIPQKYGRIINIASMYGLVGNSIAPCTPYHAAKGGVVNMTRGLAAEWGKYGITVNAICPGYFWTPLTKDTLDTEWFANYAKGAIPAQRYGKEGELDTATIFLASKASSYVNGVALPVDGGYTCV